jgi:hypothetical protein
MDAAALRTTARDKIVKHVFLPMIIICLLKNISSGLTDSPVFKDDDGSA